jgi:hypothetical protein
MSLLLSAPETFSMSLEEILTKIRSPNLESQQHVSPLILYTEPGKLNGQVPELTDTLRLEIPSIR